MGRVGGLIQGISILGAFLAMAVGSIALDSVNGYYISIVVIGLMSLLGFVLSFFFRKPKVFIGKVM